MSTECGNCVEILERARRDPAIWDSIATVPLDTKNGSLCRDACERTLRVAAEARPSIAVLPSELACAWLREDAEKFFYEKGLTTVPVYYRNGRILEAPPDQNIRR